MTPSPSNPDRAAADVAAGANPSGSGSHAPCAPPLPGAPDVVPPWPSAPAVQSACLRLAASRVQLRLALGGPETPAAGVAPPPRWWTDLLAVPAVRVLRDAVRNWWTQHPWHAAGSAAATAVNAALQPLARRHPWALVAAALLAGGLIGASRPWRWRARLAAGNAGSLPRLLNEVLATLPVASWLVLLAALAQAMSPATPAATTPEPAPRPAPETGPAPAPTDP